MIDYKETKKAMEIRGVEFTDAQFSMCLMISVGVDKYEAYMAAIIPNKIDKISEDKRDAFIDKCKRDCDILIGQNGIINLIDYLKDRYEMQVNDAAVNTENVEVTPKMLKNLLGKIIKKSNDNFDSTAYTDIIKAVSEYIKQFPMDNDDSSFSKHFILQYEPFNCVCSECNEEFDLAPNVSTVCPHCGHKYLWDSVNKKFIY